MANSIRWLTNPLAHTLAHPAVGDQVRLQCQSGWHYDVKVQVHESSGERLSGEVIAIFDHQSQAQVQASELTSELLGKSLGFSQTNVFAVFNKPKA
jgi:hypothetical protein